jgi:predicted nucleic acid-binding protein
MHLSGSRPDLPPVLVGDASFWISLVASGRVELLLNSFGAPSAITDIALAELERGRSKGRLAPDVVGALVRRGTIEVVCCAPEDEDLFLGLVVGSAVNTLDDGEAATLVCAARLGGAAVIDERKATTLAAVRFPRLPVLSTIDLMLDERVRAAVGDVVMADAVFAALTGARMRVPPKRLADMVALVGPERLASCHSLPSRLRPGAPVRPDSADVA